MSSLLENVHLLIESKKNSINSKQVAISENKARYNQISPIVAKERKISSPVNLKISSNLRSSSVKKVKELANSNANTTLLVSSGENIPAKSNKVISNSKSQVLENKKVQPTKAFFISSQFEYKAQAKAIEENLNMKLKKYAEDPFVHNKLELFQSAFNEIISKDILFGPLLKRIKEFYDHEIRNYIFYSSREKTTRFKEEVKGITDKISEYKQEKKIKTLQNKIDRLLKQNAELTVYLENIEVKYSDLQDKLIEFGKVEQQGFISDENSWKVLKLENQTLSKICQDLKKQLQLIRKREFTISSVNLSLTSREDSILKLNGSFPN